MISRLCTRREVRIRGQKYWLRWNLGAMQAFEQGTGKVLGLADADLEFTIALIWAMLLTDQPHITEFEVGSMLPVEIGPATVAVSDVLAATAAPRSEEKGERLTWRELWAIGKHDLKLSEEEFWLLEPWQLHELQQRTVHGLYGHAMTCAAFVNCHIDPEKTAPYSPNFFMPGEIGEQERKRRDVEQAASLNPKLEEFAQAWGPRVKVVRKPKPKNK